MTETNATSEYCCTCQSWQNKITACGDPVEIARKVKLAFKKMPGEMALVCFAKVMTADLPHPIKVAAWDAVRYSHIWWGVDEVLNGDVMNNPLVQQAFADAVPMRKWFVDGKRQGWGPNLDRFIPDYLASGFDFSEDIALSFTDMNGNYAYEK